MNENSCSCKPLRFFLLLQYNLAKSDASSLHPSNIFISWFFCDINIDCLHCYEHVDAINRQIIKYFHDAVPFLSDSLFSLGLIIALFSFAYNCIFLLLIQYPNSYLLSNPLLRMSRFYFIQKSLFVPLMCFWSGLIDLCAWCIAVILESPFTIILKIPFDFLLCWIFCFAYLMAFCFLIYTPILVDHIPQWLLRWEHMGHKLFETLCVCKYIFSTIELVWKFDLGIEF